ncbi:relaxase/mobilization nuclease domain-containing protein [Yersinia intermedia]|uniref:relaxase/mobilization nuclease domain-containing protein n=1 Tax=Yersinia intermedia TaxID=631 RepID=UPI00065CD2FE|nr:relaxase/mobilization nuclease domain-containing protein [Yersinia intermedia]CRY80742.1 repetative plasmid-related protein [Yersinia intermedia]
MKGMQKIKRGKNFSGVVQYTLKPGSHHKSDPVVIGGNMLSDLALELIAEFDDTKQLRPEVEKAVWHNSLRLPCGESLTNEQWVSFANDYMQRMGFSETHLRCYVLHDDEAGQHIHIIASRINLSAGKLYLGRNENLISTRIISELEITHGLTITKAASSTKPAQPKRKRVSRNEKMLSERTGEPSPKEALQQIIDKSLADTPELLTFIKRLADSQVTCKANIASTGKMNGFSFEYQGIAFKASQLGKMYSWANLQKLLNYEPERENSLLLNTRQVVPAPAPAPAPARILSYRQKETLSISEKIASLDSKIDVKEDKRKRIIKAVFDLQNSQRSKSANVTRFNSWLLLINLLKKIGFSLLYPVRNFKNIFTVHRFPPPVRSQFTANLKQQR